MEGSIFVRIMRKDSIFARIMRNRVIEDGNVSEVPVLISNGIDLKGCDRDGLTALHWTVQKGDVDIARILLDSQTNDVNCSDFEGHTVLHLACLVGHLDMVDFLLERGANVDAVDDDGWTPIFSAITEDYLEIVSVLIKHDCNVNVIDEKGYSPLHCAVKLNNIDVVRELLKSKTIDVNLTDERFGKNTALHLAAQNGYKDIAEYLIKNEVKLDALNEDNETPLQVAMKKGYTAIGNLISQAVLEKKRQLFHKENIDKAT